MTLSALLTASSPSRRLFIVGTDEATEDRFGLKIFAIIKNQINGIN
jgi:hypothetical protein